MSYRKLLTDVCDIYLPTNEVKQGSYGAPDETVTTYPDVPNYKDVPCRFVEKRSEVVSVPPGVSILQRYLVHFLKTQDIGYGYKVVWKKHGTAFRTQIPNTPQNHHIEVMAVRDERI